MPDVTSTNQEQGTDQTVAGLLSDKLTVKLLFWSMREALGRGQVRRLQSETFVQPFHQDGVNVIAVHVGEGADGRTHALSGSSGGISLSARYQQIGFHGRRHGEFAARTYLLDAQGQVLWMDIFYARSTRPRVWSTRSITTCLL